LDSLLEDISQYFDFLKEAGQKNLNVSEKSKTTIDEWWLSSEGNEKARIYIIDSKSIFFAGESGKLLIKILQAMGLEKDAVCICDISSPLALKNRIKRVKPEVIITFGKEASNLILSNNNPLQYLRGRFHEFCGIKVMPTWHPLYLLDNPDKKRDVWEDMKNVMKSLGL
jgi:uracil-DNA glycosylase